MGWGDKRNNRNDIDGWDGDSLEEGKVLCNERIKIENNERNGGKRI